MSSFLVNTKDYLILNLRYFSALKSVGRPRFERKTNFRHQISATVHMHKKLPRFERIVLQSRSSKALLSYIYRSSFDLPKRTTMIAFTTNQHDTQVPMGAAGVLHPTMGITSQKVNLDFENLKISGKYRIRINRETDLCYKIY